MIWKWFECFTHYLYRLLFWFSLPLKIKWFYNFHLYNMMCCNHLNICNPSDWRSAFSDFGQPSALFLQRQGTPSASLGVNLLISNFSYLSSHYNVQRLRGVQFGAGDWGSCGIRKRMRGVKNFAKTYFNPSHRCNLHLRTTETRERGTDL